MHPGGVRSDTHLFYFEKSANLKHPNVHSWLHASYLLNRMIMMMMTKAMMTTMMMTTTMMIIIDEDDFWIVMNYLKPRKF